MYKQICLILISVWIIPNLDWQVYLDMFPSARAMAYCESGSKSNPMGNPKALNPKDTDGLPAKGLLQFKQRTFDSWAKLIELVDINGEPVNADIKNPLHQIIVFRWAEENNLLRHWGCLRKLQRGDMAFLFY